MASATTVKSTHGTERVNFARTGVPGGNHTLASAARPHTAAVIPSTSPVDSNPCSKARRVWVNDNCASHADKPGRPASVKSSNHDPMVAASAIIAAEGDLLGNLFANRVKALPNIPENLA